MARENTIPTTTASKNYDILRRDEIENRNLKPSEHKGLRDSIKKYGMLPVFPIVCFRDTKKHLIIKEGQHRFFFAEQLQLVFYYCVTPIDFDVAIVNSAAKGWTIRDYAEKWARTIEAYDTVIDFSKSHTMSISVSAALLNGMTAFNKISDSFKDGTYSVTQADWASHVASVYTQMLLINIDLRSSGFLQAIISVCQIKGFDSTRLTQNASRCRDLLVPYSKREMYLEMLEKIYNHSYKDKQPIRFQANEAARTVKSITKAAG